ncbi:MAG: UDP-N-acetylmuramoylalanine--D-glutamate ligase [Gammaproteobacteria bacterium]|jgi:UDP-N-acetylmuramoylalanine--D-glutamate ligase|nr:UDP-N-acetylmuramoylalanine--D-glutamate ligase [Gammaproteobacteria bacterium]
MGSVVVGLGKTGASCLRYLAKHGVTVTATDSRHEPPGLAEIGHLARTLDIRLGGFDVSLLEGASQVLMSPGVSLDEPIAKQARARGIEIIGDVELFARAVRAPVIGITGTNGKSTVTSLVASMASAAGRRVLAGGNLGKPALDLLDQPLPDLYVLELSSFQLETTSSLDLLAAAVLNVTADHMDRYATVEEYARAKARILARAATVVLNADDPRVLDMRGAVGGGGELAAAADGLPERTAQDGGPADLGVAHRGPGESGPGNRGRAARAVTFSTQRADADYTLMRRAGQTFLARRGEPVFDASRMKITGLHNAANALAALALGDAAELPQPAMLDALEAFAGLPHRSAWVADIAGVRYVDDSKGTNVGATIAAVDGLKGPLILIAGGDGKGQDFAPLAAAFKGKVRHVVLIGRDAPALEQALAGVSTTARARSMEDAVAAAARAARPGDTVLLSPACSSLDMFRDYGHRGDVFAGVVRALAGAPP